VSLGPSEGKSFISGNLGYLIAQGGQRVLLMDADLRRGHQHKSFGRARGKGLADILRGDIKLEQAIQTTMLDGLHFISTGVLPDDPASLLGHGNIGGVLAALGSMYDVVVVDAPPVLAVSDAFIVAKHCTLNLLIVKHGLHSVSQVRFAMRRFERQGIKLDGGVLNDISSAAQRYAYLGYGYQYQYQYK
jgi:tyrosine-protein kinase Etk/Wzc